MLKKNPILRIGRTERKHLEEIRLKQGKTFFATKRGIPSPEKREHSIIKVSKDTPLYKKLFLVGAHGYVKTTWEGRTGIVRRIYRKGLSQFVFYPDRRQHEGSVNDRGKKKI